MLTEKKSKFIDHLQELKKRILSVAIIYLLLFFICYYFKESIITLLLKPLLASKLSNNESVKIIYTNLTEAFFTYLSLAGTVSFLLTLPVILLNIYNFIAPGLYNYEKKHARLIVFGGIILFYLGILFVYFIVIPQAWNFFISFSGNYGDFSLKLEAKISEYISLVMSLIFAFGIAFQLPTLLLLLILVKIISTRQLISMRRVAIVIIFVIAGIITPPDVFSQLALAFPMLLLYEMTIFIGKRIELGKQNA